MHEARVCWQADFGQTDSERCSELAAGLAAYLALQEGVDTFRRVHQDERVHMRIAQEQPDMNAVHLTTGSKCMGCYVAWLLSTTSWDQRFG